MKGANKLCALFFQHFYFIEIFAKTKEKKRKRGVEQVNIS